MHKPLGIKNYGSIGHLPQSRLGPGDHKVPDGQAAICIEQTRDEYDRVIVTEKLDGSNCGVALLDGQILALGRAGYLAQSSPYEQHQLFAYWVRQNEASFRKILREGERCVGEWLAQAHGTKYDLPCPPFCVFDIMKGRERAPWSEVLERCYPLVNTVPVLHDGGAVAIETIMHDLNAVPRAYGQCDEKRFYGWFGAMEEVEGAVWRVERKGKFDFMAKYVNPDKLDGKYLEKVSGQPPIWNWRPNAEDSVINL